MFRAHFRQDLSKLIELDTVTIDLFELPPLTEYEVYIKSFGSSDTRQASTQYNDSAFAALHCRRMPSLHQCRAGGADRGAGPAHTLDAGAASRHAWLRRARHR